MSETQSTLFNRRARYLSITGAFVLLVVVGVVCFLASEPVRRDPEPVKERTAETQPRRIHRTPPTVLEVSETYYRTIIDNNLFRPLGYRTPPRPIEPYRLIGTILPRSVNTLPKAIIQSTTGHQTYIVSIGEKIDASTEVVSIESKAVTLSSNGQQRTLRLNTALYLNPSPARRHPVRMTHTPTPAPIRTPTPMRRPPAVSAPQTDRPQSPSPRRPLSDWETREGERIRLGDARLKNPQKWGLRRR
ncbi:MAG: hypothetical protein OXL96_08730 [Candidatus Poribacteria bacterium]|nr:hypothetical protein [Candidatus Poribacteria bacterium]